MLEDNVVSGNNTREYSIIDSHGFVDLPEEARAVFNGCSLVSIYTVPQRNGENKLYVLPHRTHWSPPEFYWMDKEERKLTREWVEQNRLTDTIKNSSHIMCYPGSIPPGHVTIDKYDDHLEIYAGRNGHNQ